MRRRRQIFVFPISILSSVSNISWCLLSLSSSPRFFSLLLSSAKCSLFFFVPIRETPWCCFLMSCDELCWIVVPNRWFIRKSLGLIFTGTCFCFDNWCGNFLINYLPDTFQAFRFQWILNTSNQIKYFFKFDWFPSLSTFCIGVFCIFCFNVLYLKNEIVSTNTVSHFLFSNCRVFKNPTFLLCSWTFLTVQHYSRILVTHKQYFWFFLRPVFV